MDDDGAMLEIITTTNIACGYHTDDHNIIREAVRLAKEKGVSLGAHPGYKDLIGFGRHLLPGVSNRELESFVAYQVALSQSFPLGKKCRHVLA